MDNNILSSSATTQSISLLPTASLPSKKGKGGDLPFMFYVMKSLQDTLKSDKDCLQREIREKQAKEAIEKVLLSIKGLSNKRAFLESLLKSGISNSDVKSYVSGLLGGIKQQQAKEKELDKQEKQAEAKMAADKDLTKYPAYEDKYVLSPDLKGEESSLIHPSSFLDWLKGEWNQPKNLLSTKGREYWKLLGCKIAERILKNPTARKDIGKVVNSSFIKSFLGLNDKNKKSKMYVGQVLPFIGKNPFISEAFRAAFTYKDQINKWIDKREEHLGKKVNDLSEKIETKGQPWYKYVGQFSLDVVDTIRLMVCAQDGKAFHRITGDSSYKISPDKTSEKSWQKQTNSFETNAQNLSDLIVKADENNINMDMQQNQKSTKSLEQTIKGLSAYSEMLNQLVQSNKV